VRDSDERIWFRDQYGFHLAVVGHRDRQDWAGLWRLVTEPLRSALLNDRSQAKTLPLTDERRWP
jgi:hypothetical protein